MDFLLSLSPKAKEKLATIKAPNKSVNYADQVLNEEDVSVQGFRSTDSAISDNP